ncbi:MAG: hypothetical protein BROFUL_03390 [Candidatus Brocadia fulgida]|uniref:Uncharacterized protein n=1 Tax=Candidatus Brocadia fulgida TaxID=380242 RepID=A0A0M2UTY3_9BACT|nr:MAG: hypothetical protein BROFUL_03390 [Candidatus Brocadia fulgida]
MRYVTTLVFLAAAAYATLRYNVFKGVPWSDWSTYVMNKAVALSALAFMALEVFRSRRYLIKGSRISCVLPVCSLPPMCFCR